MRHPALVLAAAFAAAAFTAPHPARAGGDAFADAEEVAAWTARLDTGRTVVDRVVVCFDRGSFLTEIAKWDEKSYWPVLLWDSDITPKFVAAFTPQSVLIAGYAAKSPAPGADELAAGLRTVAAAWGVAPEKAPVSAAEFLAVLTARGRTPNGVVLLSAGAPDLLGGIALAAGRLQLPLVFETAEGRDQGIKSERMDELRVRLTKELTDLGIDFELKLDDLDFVTVAADLPFAYTPSSPGVHQGRYTVDDAIARHDGGRRWGWVGRLTGGDARSVYMTMGALFLQPQSGLLWSRYDPKNKVFGVFDPLPALETFQDFFPTETVRHPDATLDRWRELEWPAGNRFGFVYVNSSGGATSWSMSGGKATHFDVPDTIPAVVHYTHSGSAGQPFNTDTIAGRWMAGGAYVYFGSHAEPYLQAFISPSVLAERVAKGIPLGAAMRQLLSPGLVGARKMKVGGVEQLVRFNMSGPWKLAYFGDPSYRLLREPVARVVPEELTGRYFSSTSAFRRAKVKATAGDRDAATRHAIAAAGTVLLDGDGARLVDQRGWAKLVKATPQGPLSDALERVLLCLWVASLRRAPERELYAKKTLRSRLTIPTPLQTLIARGAADTDGARLVTEFAKSYVASLPAHADTAIGKSPADALPVLVAACSLVHSKGAAKPLYAWLDEAARGLGIAPDDLQAAVLAQKWLPDAIRKTVEAAVKGPLE